jgi:pimeloyl-ACP methyl ester carboxylesterase
MTAYRAHRLDVDGCSAFVEDAGEGPVLLCVHTAGQTGVQWAPLLTALPAAGMRVLVPDLPGHGRTDPAPGGPVEDLTYYRDWLLRVLDALGVEEFAVVGCSIGGKIALDLAAVAGGRVRGTVAMAADARNPLLSVGALRRGMEASTSPSVPDRTYLGTLASCGASVDRARAEHVATMHRREDPVVSNADLVGWSTHDLRDRLPDITGPVRWVIGEDDFWLDPASARAGAALVPKCTFEVLDGIGHYPMEEIADFPDLLLGWLREWS